MTWLADSKCCFWIELTWVMLGKFPSAMDTQNTKTSLMDV